MQETFFDALCLFYLPILAALLVFTLNREKSERSVSPAGFLVMCVLIVGSTGVFTVLWDPRHALFALEFSLGMVLSLANPVTAACFLVANVIIRPWELSDSATSMAIIPKLMGAVTAGSWIFHGLRRKRFFVIWDSPTRLLILLGIWFLLSAAMGGSIDTSMTAYSNTFMIAAIIFILVSNILKEPRDMKMMEFSIVTSVLSVVAVSLYSTWLKRATDPTARLEGFGILTGNANDLAALVALAFPLLALLIVGARAEARARGRRGPRFARFYRWFAVFIFGAGLLFAQSRGALIGLIVSAVVYTLIRAKNKRRAFVRTLMFAPVALGIFVALNHLRVSEDVQESTESRWNYVVTGVNMAIHHPILGVGFDNYPNFYEQYAPGIEYEWGKRTAHSSWVLALAENGVPGFLLFAGLYLVTLKRAWRLRSRFPELLLAMCSYGVAMSFLSHTYLFFPYLLLSLVVAGTKMREVPTETAPLASSRKDLARVVDHA